MDKDYKKLYEELYAEHLDLIKRIKDSCYTWIPCSERMPDCSGLFLVTVVHRYCDTDEYTNIFKVIYDFGYNSWIIDEYYKVIAWMPLPKPYKGEQNE